MYIPHCLSCMVLPGDESFRVVSPVFMSAYLLCGGGHCFVCSLSVGLLLWCMCRGAGVMVYEYVAFPMHMCCCSSVGLSVLM